MANDPPLDIRLLQCLAALVAERSVTRAAERLGASQPAMSHNLAKLRRIFADPILTRGQEGLTPTARAIELAARAGEALRSVAAMTEPLAPFDPRSSTTTFVVTATEYTEHVLVSDLIAAMRAEAPGVRLEIRPPDPQQAMGWLERREVDCRLGWVYEPEPILRSRLLFEEELVVIARAKHPFVDGAITTEDFLQCPHVTSDVAGWRTTGRSIDEALGALAGQLDRRLRIQNALSVPAVVANSDLIATVPWRLATAHGAGLDLQVLPPPMKLPPYRCAAYWHDAVHRDARHAWFRDILIRTARAGSASEDCFRPDDPTSPPAAQAAAAHAPGAKAAG